MPDESYYPEHESDEGMEGGKSGGDPGMGKETHSETTLVPKSMFEGKELNPGDEFYFTVVRVHENEVEVEYKHDEKGEKGEHDEAEEGHEGAFDRMMGGGGGGGGMAGMGGTAMGGY